MSQNHPTEYRVVMALLDEPCLVLLGLILFVVRVCCRAGALALLAGHRDAAHPELRNLPLYALNVELKRAT